MIKVTSNTTKNRLYLKLAGLLTVQEINEGIEKQLKPELKKMKAGFSIISDISEFKPTSEEGRQLIQVAMGEAKKAGMGDVVRIVPNGEALITANQWQRTSRQAGYMAVQVQDLAEAEKLLDKMAG
jgi:hypothetical protein